MWKMRTRSVVGLILATAALLSASTQAHAVTTDVSVVSAFAHWETTGAWIEPDTGWANDSTTGARAESNDQNLWMVLGPVT